jgi:predicted dienelactone hydrolase
MAKSLLFAAFLVSGIALNLPMIAQNNQKTLHLPSPDGSHAIGTKSVMLSDPSRHRDLMVTLWYPSVPGTMAAPYMDNRTAAAIASDWELQPNFVHSIRTNASLESAFGKGGPFPLVLLEHGSGVVPAVYNILAEGLASHGFIVVAINHPPDSLKRCSRMDTKSKRRLIGQKMLIVEHRASLLGNS